MSIENNLPFIIGVSGHRDLSPADDIDQIRSRVIAVLEYWRAAVTSDTPIWLLTGLATGADSLVTDIACELRTRWGQSSVKIIACLPMPVDAYRSDFKNLDFEPTALDGFESRIEALSQGDDEVLVVRSQLDSCDYEKALQDTQFGDERNNLYLNQGVFIAKYAQVLVALWDGKPAAGAGGTADVVGYKLGERTVWPLGSSNPALEPISEFDGQVGGVVHHIPMNQSHEDTFVDQLCTFDSEKLEGPVPDGTSVYVCSKNAGRNHKEIRAFLSRELATLLQQLKVYNRSETTVNERARETSGLCWAHAIFSRADAVAIEYQRRYRRISACFFGAVVLALSVLEFAGDLLDEVAGTWSVISVLSLLTVAFLIAKYSGSRDFKWKYQIARGIAEGMRIRGYLNLCDIGPLHAPLVPRRHRINLTIINHAISVGEFEWWSNPRKPSLELINEAWIQQQIEFLKSRLELKLPITAGLTTRLYKRPLRAHNKLFLLSKAFFWLGVTFGIAISLVMLSELLVGYQVVDVVKTMMMYGVQYSLMTAGVIALWHELAGYENTAKGYESLIALYERAQGFVHGDLTNEKKFMLVELAKEAMLEHVSWTHSESEIDIKNR